MWYDAREDDCCVSKGCLWNRESIHGECTVVCVCACVVIMPLMITDVRFESVRVESSIYMRNGSFGNFGMS